MDIYVYQGIQLGARAILAIDTSTRYGGVSIWHEGQMSSAQSWRSLHSHTTELMPAIKLVLQATSTTVHDLSMIAIALGPGGFSSLRVGISVAKGLALAARIPIIGIGTLETEAYPYADTNLTICPILTAGKQRVSTALFKKVGHTWQQIQDDQVLDLQELPSTVPKGALLCGEGVMSHIEFLKTTLSHKSSIIEFHSPTTRLQALAALAMLKADTGFSDNTITLQPRYIRTPSIGAPKIQQRVNL